MLALILAGAAYLFTTHGVFGWLATLLVRRGIATRLVAVLTAGQIVGTVGMPIISDYAGRRAPFVALAGASFGVVITGFGVWEPSLAVFGLGCAVAGMAIGSVSPLLRVLLLELVRQGAVSTIVSMVFEVGAVGGFLGPVLIGAAASRVSLPWVFGLLAFPGLVLVLVSILFSSMAKQ